MGYTVSGFMGREIRRKIRENNVQRGTLLKADGTVDCDNNTYKKNRLHCTYSNKHRSQ